MDQGARWLDPVWMQHGVDAIRATVDADPALKPKMVEFLLAEGFWDPSHLSWAAAIARFNACCNPQKGEFFKISELWALMKRFRRYDLFHAMARDLGFEVRAIACEARQQELLEQVARQQEALLGAFAELQRLQALSVPEPARLDPAIREGTGRFSHSTGGGF